MTTEYTETALDLGAVVRALREHGHGADGLRITARRDGRVDVEVITSRGGWLTTERHAVWRSDGSMPECSTGSIVRLIESARASEAKGRAPW